MEIPPLDEMNPWKTFPAAGRATLALLLLFAAVEIAALLARPRNRPKPLEIRSMLAIGACSVNWALSLLESARGPLLPAWTGIFGVLLFASGIALRTASFLQLGRFYDPAITLHEGHRLVQTGPYRFMRHPLYAGSLLLFAGFPLAFSSAAGLASFFLLVIPVFSWRVRIEERALRGRFGSAWDAYARHTRRWGLF